MARAIKANERIIRRLDPGDIQIKSIDEKTRTIWHPITREVPDRYGDIVRIDGAELSEFQKKPGVLYGHDYRSMNPIPVIAEGIGFEKDGDRLIAGTRFIPVETPGMSRALQDLINDNWILQAKKLLGWSIGFMPVDWDAMMEHGEFVGYDFKKWSLIEYSSVIIPAHQDAINDALKRGLINGAVVKYFDLGQGQEERPAHASPDAGIAVVKADGQAPAPGTAPASEPPAAAAEAQEKSPQKQEATPDPIQEPKPAPGPEAKATENQKGGSMLQEIMKKLAKGEALSQEEQAYLAKFEAELKGGGDVTPKRHLELGGAGIEVRSMTDIMGQIHKADMPGGGLNDVERELQTFADNAYITATILGINPRRLKMWDGVLGRSSALKKAMDTATANEGAEWVPTLLSADFLERMRFEARVPALFRDVPMPSDPYKYPYSAGLSASDFYYVEQSKSDSPVASPPSTLGTAGITLTGKKLKARIPFSDEISEDSIVPVIDHLRSELGKAGVEVVEDVILNGQATAAIDSNVTDSKDRRKAWDGLRYLCASGNKADHGTFSTANFLALLKTMGKYGVTAGQLAIICGSTGYHLFRALSEVLTVDKYGPNATILTGEIGKLAGIPIIVSDYVYQNLNASGVYDGSTTTKGVYLIVNRNAFLLGSRGGIKLTFKTEDEVDQSQLIMRFRKAFQPVWTPSATYTTVALGYNVA